MIILLNFFLFVPNLIYCGKVLGLEVSGLASDIGKRSLILAGSIVATWHALLCVSVPGIERENESCCIPYL